jgi:hypothetical protein
VHLLNIYTLEAHPVSDRPMDFSHDPDGNPIDIHLTYEDRVEMAKMTIQEEDLLMPVLVDEIDNPLWCTYGRMPNNSFLIGMDGRIVFQQIWNNPDKMEQAIIEYLEGGS